MSAWYNENDPFAADWLRALMAAGEIGEGTVDERSIREVQPADVGSGRAHFFAGIGGWDYALRLAGVADDARVWTGSCPCQPFSAAGKRRAADDDRHLWPEWFRLIRECRPAILFGEQVANGDGLLWLDAVLSDLEGEGYAVGAADLCAAGIGAPHARQRVFFGAYAQGGDGRVPILRRRPDEDSSESGGHGSSVSGACALGSGTGDAGRGADGSAASGMQGAAWERERLRSDAGERGADGGHRDPERQGLEGHAGHVRNWRGPGWIDPLAARSASEAGATRGFWGDCDWWWGRDGKWRPAGPGVQPLVAGISRGVVPSGDISVAVSQGTAEARIGRLSGYGNAINVWVAVEFIAAFLEALHEGSVQTAPSSPRENLHG